MTDPKTAAMVEAMLNRNENFHGTSVNEAKMNLFTEIRQESDELAHLMRGKIAVRPPENTRRNAMVMLDLPLPVSIFNESVRSRLAKLIEKADDVSFAAPESSTMRVTFGVHGVWEDGTQWPC